MSEACAIRVTIQHTALAQYRVPVFAELARRPGIALKVVYGSIRGLPNATPAGFDAVHAAQRSIPLPGRRLFWHGAQWTYACRSRSDVLILSWNLNCLTLVPALLRARRRGVATILWGHGYSKRAAGWRSGVRGLVAHLASAVMFYGHTHAQRLIDQGFDRDRVFVALNSLDQAPIERARAAWLADPQRLAAFRRQEDLEGRPLVLFVSRLVRDNRVDRLIDAVAALASDFPRLRAIIIGGGEDEPRLRARAAAAGVGERVRFLGPIYEEDRLAPWFLSAEVFCYPSNIGLSLLHAFGYGLPVVTTDRIESQNPEIEALRNGENGMLYDETDPQALGAALRQILSDRALGARLSGGALATVRERFTLQAMVDGMERAIRACAGKSGARRCAPSPR